MNIDPEILTAFATAVSIVIGAIKGPDMVRYLRKGKNNGSAEKQPITNGAVVTIDDKLNQIVVSTDQISRDVQTMKEWRSEVDATLFGVNKKLDKTDNRIGVIETDIKEIFKHWNQ